jgi:hypothetical protein
MFAYSPNRTKIVGIHQTTPGTVGIDEGSFTLPTLGNDGENYEFDGTGPQMAWDDQKDIYKKGQRIFVDEDGGQYPECSLVYLDIDLDDPDFENVDEETEKLFTNAEAAYDMWEAQEEAVSYLLAPTKDGWRDIGSFDEEEKDLLRPIAETIAMLSGNAFFGMKTDSDDNDLLYEDYLPQAAALYASAGQNASLTSIAQNFASRRKKS